MSDSVDKRLNLFSPVRLINKWESYGKAVVAIAFFEFLASFFFVFVPLIISIHWTAFNAQGMTDDAYAKGVESPLVSLHVAVGSAVVMAAFFYAMPGITGNPLFLFIQFWLEIVSEVEPIGVLRAKCSSMKSSLAWAFKLALCVIAQFGGALSAAYLAVEALDRHTGKLRLRENSDDFKTGTIARAIFLEAFFSMMFTVAFEMHLRYSPQGVKPFLGSNSFADVAVCAVIQFIGVSVLYPSTGSTINILQAWAYAIVRETKAQNMWTYLIGQMVGILPTFIILWVLVHRNHHMKAPEKLQVASGQQMEAIPQPSTATVSYSQSRFHSNKSHLRNGANEASSSNLLVLIPGK
jgi:hypothetical protein